MPEIRPLEKSDLTAVVRLLRERIERWPGDETFLRRTVLEHPWSDPELPSLVALGDDGRLAGFVGSQARRLRFKGEPIRGVVCSHLVVAPDAGAAGALLLTRLLRGSQSLTWSDSANEPVVRMWRAFGGRLDHARACDWMLVLNPVRWIGSSVRTALRQRSIGRDVLPVGALPVHALAPRRGRFRPPEKDPRVRGRPVTPDEIVSLFPDYAAKWQLAVDHDPAHLAHVLALIGVGDDVTCRAVSFGDRLIGWYAYIARGTGAWRVLHVAATEKLVEPVFAELVEHARRTGCPVLAGRAEPHLDLPVSARLAAIGYARQPVIHARDPELLAAAGSSASLLTQLDSEWFVP